VKTPLTESVSPIDSSIIESELKVHFTIVGLRAKDFESTSIKKQF
jgi:hypothetical protein